MSILKVESTMGSALDDEKKYKVFCPHCGHTFTGVMLKKTLWTVLNARCSECHKYGRDAVEIAHAA